MRIIFGNPPILAPLLIREWDGQPGEAGEVHRESMAEPPLGRGRGPRIQRDRLAAVKTHSSPVRSKGRAGH